MHTDWQASTTPEGAVTITRLEALEGRGIEVVAYRYRGGPMTLQEAQLRARVLNIGQEAADALEIPAGTTRRQAARMRREAAEHAQQRAIGVTVI